MAGMSRWLLCAAFVVAGIPFTGLVGSGIRYVFGDHPGERLPNWYGWIFALAALILSALFATAAFAVAARTPPWAVVFRATAVGIPIVALASLGSPPLVAGSLALLLATWVLKRRDADREREPEPPAAPSDV